MTSAGSGMPDRLAYAEVRLELGRDVLDVVPVREDEREAGSDAEGAERGDERVHAQHGHDERIRRARTSRSRRQP